MRNRAKCAGVGVLLLGAVLALTECCGPFMPRACAHDASQRRDDEPLANPFPGKGKAPSLHGGVEWLNTAGPITWEALRGKIVLLDFWTYCCINCMHVIPDLKKLEHKYANQLVVIGVHSAKFDEEKDSQNIREAVLRYGIEHPVLNDANMAVWRRYNVQSWPTLWLVDPEGLWVGYLSGEGVYDTLDRVIMQLAEYHRAKGTLNETPVRFELERYKAEPSPLYFPGKVLADAANDRLFISDSNNNRIVMCSLEGKLRGVIGSGEAGQQDGPLDQAKLFRPQGMALQGDTLYIADTENHLIRAADLEAGQLTTVAGTGVQGYSRSSNPAPARQTPLNSPWDLWMHGGLMYIAMAGPHQIWIWDPAADTVYAYAGSGMEDIIDGPLRTAAFAQPSGLTSDGEFLYVADSEGSSIRAVPFQPGGDVTTVLGTSHLPHNRLFTFGDRDGGPKRALFQHVLGVAWDGGNLYVADTYNNKIKVIDLKTRISRTMLGSTRPGSSDEPPRFDEPGGLAVADGKLYVADTNNHAIRVVDLGTLKLSTLVIDGLEPPARARAERAVAPDVVTTLAQHRVAAASDLNLAVRIALRSGYKLNPLAPMSYTLQATQGSDLISVQGLGEPQGVSEPDTRFDIPLRTKGGGDVTLRLSLTYFPCQTQASGICEIRTVVLEVPLQILSGETNKTVPLLIEDKAADRLPGSLR